MFDPSIFAHFEGELRRVSYAAKKLDCSEDHVVALVDDGEIEYIDIASKNARRRDVRFTDQQLDEFAVSRTRRVASEAAPRKCKKAKASASNDKSGSFAARFLSKHPG